MTREDLVTMNFVKNGILISLCFIFSFLLAQANTDLNLETDTSFFDAVISRRRALFVKTELVRFLNEAGQTEFHLNYKIPNNELQFIQEEQGFVSTLNVKFDIYLGDNLVSPNRFEHYAGARTVSVAQSENHFVLDKISFTLAREGFSAVLEIQDKNASTIYTEKIDLTLLDSNSIVSDIEVSQGVSTELTPALDKFQRGQYQFYVDPIPVIDGNNKDFIIYHQVSNIVPGADSLYRFFEFITVKKDTTLVWESEYNHLVEFLPYPLIKRIPLGDYEPGLYTIEVKILDPKKQRVMTTQRDFSLSRKYVLLTQRVFADDNEEFELISYFLDNRQKRMWRDLNEEGRKNFIERFWIANNPNPGSQENLFLQTVRQRVNEANWRFSHHRAGWKTDLGRIYIKTGSPDNIDKKETEPDARYSRKNYQVWKYYGADKTYLFLDFQNNGNYRLIYSKNDTSENTDPGWKSYFGDNFEESSLEF